VPHNGKFRLKNLDFDEVSLVNSGDDPQALVVLSKAAPPAGKDLNVLGTDFNFMNKRRPKLGSGKRFKQLTAELRAKGVKNPEALAAYIGRKKFGGKKFAQLGHKKG
jgi:hypothetical protein